MPRHRHTHTLIALALGLVAVPAAQAYNLDDSYGGSAQGPAVTSAGAPASASLSPPDRLDGSTGAPAPASLRPPDRIDAAAGRVPIQIVSASPVPAAEAFDWADAGVGFGAAAGLALLAGGSLRASRRLRRPPAPAG